MVRDPSPNVAILLWGFSLFYPIRPVRSTPKTIRYCLLYFHMNANELVLLLYFVQKEAAAAEHDKKTLEDHVATHR